MQILEKILQYLNVNDLKSCRLVNRLWNITATPFMKYQLEEVTFGSIRGGKFLQYPQRIPEFCTTMKSMVNFPFTSFRFYLQQVSLQELETFSGQFGDYVESLHLIGDGGGYMLLDDNSELGSVDEEYETGESIIYALNHFPVLKTLRIEHGGGSGSVKVKLPNTSTLTHLVLEPPFYSIFLDIIQQAKNLKRLEVDTSENMVLYDDFEYFVNLKPLATLIGNSSISELTLTWPETAECLAKFLGLLVNAKKTFKVVFSTLCLCSA